jgi:hypothetical protein
MLLKSFAREQVRAGVEATTGNGRKSSAALTWEAERVGDLRIGGAGDPEPQRMADLESSRSRPRR